MEDSRENKLINNKVNKDENNDKSKAIIKEVMSWVRPFVFAFVIAMIVKSQLLVFAKVPSCSMSNTIQKKDMLIGNRVAYKISEPKRGDVVIFKYPDDEDQLFIKRLIGLPGETVKIEDGKVYINDSKEPLDEPYIKEIDWGNYDGALEYNVPEGCYFMLGDNRNNSKDSREWKNTFVTEDELVARAEFIWFPFTHISGL